MLEQVAQVSHEFPLEVGVVLEVKDSTEEILSGFRSGCCEFQAGRSRFDDEDGVWRRDGRVWWVVGSGRVGVATLAWV